MRYGTRLAALAVLSVLAGCATSPADDMSTLVDPVAEARAALLDGAADEALQRYRAHLADHPDDLAALAGLGFAQLDLQQYDAAHDTFRQALARDPQDPASREGAALADLARGQVADAVPKLRELAQQPPVSWRVFNGLGVIADLDGEFAVAADFYQRARAAGGDNVVVANNLGYSTLMSGDAAAARTLLQEALLRYPRDVRLQQNLGLAEARSGDYARAVQTLSAVMPEWEALNNVGYMAMLNGALEIAHSHLQRALDSSPRFYPQAAANLERVEALMTLASGAGTAP